MLTANRFGPRSAASGTLPKRRCVRHREMKSGLLATSGEAPPQFFGQFVNNRIIVPHELQGFNISSIAFAPIVKKTLEQKFPGYRFQACGDPKGGDKNQADERTSFDVFKSVGIPMRPAPVKMNAIETRLVAVDSVLTSLHDGKSRLLISPTCRTLITAMEGAYCFERKVSSSEIKTEPAKNKYSHVADGFQYLCVSLGEGRRMDGLEPVGELKPKLFYKGHRSMRRVVA